MPVKVTVHVLLPGHDHVRLLVPEPGRPVSEKIEALRLTAWLSGE